MAQGSSKRSCAESLPQARPRGTQRPVDRQLPTTAAHGHPQAHRKTASSTALARSYEGLSPPTTANYSGSGSCPRGIGFCPSGASLKPLESDHKLRYQNRVRKQRTDTLSFPHYLSLGQRHTSGKLCTSKHYVENGVQGKRKGLKPPLNGILPK